MGSDGAKVWALRKPMIRVSPALRELARRLNRRDKAPRSWDTKPSLEESFLKCFLQCPWPDASHGFPLCPLNVLTSRKGKQGSRICHFSSKTRCRSF